MSVEVREAKQQSYGNKNGRRVWRVSGTLDYAEAVTAVFGGGSPVAPSQWGDLSLTDYNCDEKGLQFWEVTATYGSSNVEVLPGIVQVTIDTTGATVHQHCSDVGRPGNTFGDSTDNGYFGGAIGVSQDGLNVAGVDVPTPKLGIEFKTRFTSAQVTDAYIAQIYAATGRINNAAWRGYKAEELLFLGARLNQLDALSWEATFVMQGSFQKDSFTIPASGGTGSITVTSKKGWQYLWVYFKAGTKTTGGLKKALPLPSIVRCEDLFPVLDFDLLAIPGSSEDPFGLDTH